ncbi:MAG: 2-polyprenyl-3-methyl-6-methoxy-1,4-benzoquinone monooxygenase [Nevskia sp.]
MRKADAVDHGRDYSPADRALLRIGRGLQALARGPFAPRPVGENYPAARIAEAPLAEPERRKAAGLMRVNHAGEVSAQALYQGQALVARTPALRSQLLQAAAEERDHLEWCDARLRELGDQPSVLSPLWYAGSFMIGAAAGLVGDRASLGFVEETERQVVEHLDEHLGQLPRQDRRSRAIVNAMKRDEARHGEEAAAAGAVPVPAPVRSIMKGVARIMKFGAYRI